MNFQDNLAVTTCLQDDTPTENNQQVAIDNGSSLLKKRSHRLMSLIKKQSGGPQIQPASSVFHPQQQTSSRSANAMSKIGANSVQIEKSQVVGKTTRKYNMRQPRASRTRNSFAATKGTNDNDLLTNESKDIVSVSSPGLRKNSMSIRESKETLPPRTIDEAHEDQIIKLLEIHQRQRLEQDPIRELDEALMDRTTASLNRRQKITSVKANTIFVEQVSNQIASFVIRDSCSILPQKGGENDTVSEGSSSSPVPKSNNSDQYNLNQYQIGEDSITQEQADLPKQKRNVLLNTLESMGDCQQLQLDHLRSKRSQNYMDTCSTNITGQIGFELNGGENSEYVSPDLLNDSNLQNKRNLKSYQKKKSLKQISQNVCLPEASKISSTRQMTSKSQKLDENEGGYLQNVNIQKIDESDLNEIKYWKEEQKGLSSQDNLPHIQLDKIDHDTPQQFYQYNKFDQNQHQSFLKPNNLDQSKKEVISNKSKQDLLLMNQFIRPLPLFDQKGIYQKSYMPVAGSKNLIKFNGMEKKKKNKSKLKSSRKHQDYLIDQQFRNLTFKMVGLSNMISLMNATGQTKAFTSSSPFSSPFGNHQIQNLQLNESRDSLDEIIRMNPVKNTQNFINSSSMTIETQPQHQFQQPYQKDLKITPVIKHEIELDSSKPSMINQKQVRNTSCKRGRK